MPNQNIGEGVVAKTGDVSRKKVPGHQACIMTKKDALKWLHSVQKNLQQEAQAWGISRQYGILLALSHI